MTDADALLRMILENPDDDTVRLVFADALEEQGDAERAEFIRVQCEIAKICPTELTAYHALPARERELLKSHFGAWTSDFPESLVTKQCPSCVDQAPDWETNAVECAKCECTGLVPDDERVEFTRGLVSEITCSYRDYAANLDLWARHPITRVVFPESQPDVGPAIGIGGNYNARWYRTLVESGRRGLVPAELFDLLETLKMEGQSPEFPHWFMTPEIANEGLSRTAVTLARRHVGLPDLWGAKEVKTSLESS